MSARFSVSRVFAAVSTAMLLAGGAVSAGAAPLPDVVRHVLATHPDAASAKALLDAAGAKVGQARSAFFPVAGLSYENARETEQSAGSSVDRDTSRADATLRWNLFRGFSDRAALDSARAAQRASEAELAAVRESLALRVLEIYLDVLKNERLVDVSEAQLESLDALARRVATRAAMGRVSKVAVHQARTRLVQARNRHVQLKAALDSARLRFRELTGLEPEGLERPTIDTTAVAEPVETLYQVAEEASPRIKAARDDLLGRKADEAAAAGALLPTVDLELRKRLFSDLSPDGSLDPESAIRLTVNYQFETGGAGLGRKAEAGYRKSAARARLESLQREIRAEIAAVSRQWVEDHEIAPVLQENVASAKAVVDAYHLQFDAGRRTLLDLLTAYGDLYQAEAAVIENRYRQMLSSGRLQSLLGRLSASLLASAAGETGVVSPR